MSIFPNWIWYLILGVALVVTGILAISYATLATIISIVYLGALLLANAFIHSIQAFKFKNFSEFFLHLLMAVVYGVIGFFIVSDPLINAMALTLILAALFLVSGIFKIGFALQTHLSNRWWIVLSGVLSVILGLLIWRQFPTTSLWVIGLFIGIELLFSGWTWIFLSLRMRQLGDYKLKA